MNKVELELRDRWRTLLKATSSSYIELSDWQFERLILEYYNSANRSYHNLNHIYECFKALDKIKSQYNNDDFGKVNDFALSWAIFFHDIVYDVNSSNNEERSADLARLALRAMGGHHLEGEIDIAIKSTAFHTEPLYIASSLTKCLLDIDLVSLAINFDESTKLVAKEYPHVSKKVFLAGRAAFLKQLLNRPHIYYTKKCRELYDSKARDNIIEFVELYGE